MSAVRQLGAELDQKRQELHKLFENTKTDKIDPLTGGPLFEMDSTLLTEVRNRKDELIELEQKFQAARLAEEYAENLKGIQDLHSPDRRFPVPSGGGAAPDGMTRGAFIRSLQNEGKSLADFVLESREYKARGANPKKHFSLQLEEFDMKTLLSTGAGYAPPNNRGPQLVPFALRRLVVSDLIPQDTTTASLIKYMEETTFSDNAATVSESGIKPEAQLEYTERSVEVEKIAVWIPVTEEQLDDVPQMRGIIEDRLREMVRREEEDQLLTGNGTSPNIRGFLNATNIQTQAIGADNAADAIFKAMTKVRWTGYAEPSGVVLHPNDWEPIRLLKTSDLEYIWGHPAVVGPDTLWGKPVVVTNAITENTGLVGDFVMFSRIYRKLGLRVDVSDSHSDFFVYNKLAIRAEERLALAIFRGSAFCKVTGL